MSDQILKTEVTRLLSGTARPGGSAELLALVYDELRRLAAVRIASLPPGQTLQPTALVHEAYARLVADDVQWNGRGHFFAAAAQAMRNILVDAARRKARVKHGGQRRRMQLDEAVPGVEADGTTHQSLLDLDAALDKLAAENPRKAEVVMLRYFAGLSVEDTALALGVSEITVKRDWVFAKAWLFDAMGGEH